MTPGRSDDSRSAQPSSKTSLSIAGAFLEDLLRRIGLGFGVETGPARLAIGFAARGGVITAAAVQDRLNLLRLIAVGLDADERAAATGGLLGALKESGHSDEEANVYSEGVRRGGTLVSVKADGDEAQRIQAILDGSRGYDAATRGEAYRQSGWSGFDADAKPYTSEQILEERARYR